MKKSLICTALVFLMLKVSGQATSTLDHEKLLDMMQGQRYKEAVLYIQSVYPDGGSDNKIISRLAYCQYMAGNLQEAEKNYLILHKRDSLNITYLFSLANVNLKRGNNSNALSYLKKSLLTDSSNFSIFKQLGQIGLLTGDSSSTGYLQKASSLNPTDPDVAYDLSNQYILQKKFGRADTILSEAISADSTNMLLIRTRAKLCYARDKWPELIDLCQKLIREGDESMMVVNWLGEGYYKTKQYRRCIETFQKAERLGLEKESSLYFTAKSYKNLSDNTNAVKYFRRTIESATSPNIGNYYTEVGDSQEKLKQNQSALASYIKSLQFDESPYTYYMVANLYDLTLKNSKMAAQYYKKFLKSATAEKKVDKQYLNYAKTRLEEIKR